MSNCGFKLLKKLQMTYASLWSFSYFAFTLNQLLTPDTRAYVYTKIWAIHRYSYPLSTVTMVDRALRNGTTVNHSWPWLTMLLRNGYTTVMMTMVDHGHGDHSWPWLTTLWEMAPRSTMVDHGQAMVSDRGAISQSAVNHGWTMVKFHGLTMVNHGRTMVF